jgi:mutator protein MutT
MKQVTLLFLRREGQLLLAMKKRGFGEGFWNGVGGKIEPGETIEQAVVRECREEIGVTPQNIRAAGRLEFYVKGRPEHAHNIHIFSCTEWSGEPVETAEMRPQWFDLPAIPYDSMWPDDRLWLPHLIGNQPFTGNVTVDAGNTVIESQINVA